MKYWLHWIVAFALALSAASCSVNQEFIFEGDYSGKSVNTVDLSTMRLLLPRFDSASSFTSVQDSVIRYAKQVADSLAAVDGIQEVQHSWDDSAAVIRLSYHFNDLNSLNQAFLMTNPGTNARENPCFNQKWRRFSFRAPHFIDDNEIQGIPPTERSYFPYTLDLIFAEPVRSAEGRVAVSEGSRRVRYQGNLLETFSDTSNIKISVKTR